MVTYQTIYNNSINLPTFQKKALVKELLHRIAKSNHDEISLQYISQFPCPHCKSTKKVKNGMLNSRQRYLCKKCGKSYTTLTNTPVSYSKKDKLHWEKYIELLLNCESLRSCAKKLNISLSTAFYWRHKLLDALRENLPKQPLLSDSIKILEVYTRESFKGSMVPSNRSPYKCGEKRKYNFLSNNDVCILIALDGKNPPLIEMSCLNKPTDDTLEAIFANKLTAGSAIITDKWIPYKRLAIKNNLIYVPYLNRYCKSRFYHSKEVDKISKNILCFLGHFQGVATKYLENYLCLFKRLFCFTLPLDYDLHTNKNQRISDYKFREPLYK